MMGVDYVHKTLKHMGKGVRVCILDTDIDYTHAALGGCFGKGYRVHYEWDFVGDDVTKPKQKCDTCDHCHGHGTHVAGIVGADARKVGAPHPFVRVAPEVTFGAYRVLDCNDPDPAIMFTLLMIQYLFCLMMIGIELAFNQGMHVINMSLGGGASYKTNPIAALAEKVTAHGMVGNAGLGNLSTSVASFDNVSAYHRYFKYAGIALAADTVGMFVQSLPDGFAGLTGTVGFPTALIGELRIKPDISAPGGNIYSTFPVHMSSYAIESDISISGTYTAGAHALLFSAHKKILFGRHARRILKSTAVSGRRFMEVYLSSVAKQDAGLINVKSPIVVKTAISPKHIQLLDTVHFAGKSAEVNIKNLGKKTTTYRLSHEASIAEISGNKVTVKAGQLTKAKIQFSQPATGKAEQFPFYSGYIIATPNGRDIVSVRIPYACVKGAIAKVPTVDSNLDFPVFQINSGQQPLVKDQQIDFSKDEVYLGIHLGSHTPDLRVILTESVSRKFSAT
ncbi:hypothetical protein BGZ93_009766 [Podila epicladia]|nr:hypothetical protein BGZ93_009766 [Podila epicladia]